MGGWNCKEDVWHNSDDVSPETMGGWNRKEDVWHISDDGSVLLPSSTHTSPGVLSECFTEDEDADLVLFGNRPTDMDDGLDSDRFESGSCAQHEGGDRRVSAEELDDDSDVSNTPAASGSPLPLCTACDTDGLGTDTSKSKGKKGRRSSSLEELRCKSLESLR